jgi:hypothetical protein
VVVAGGGEDDAALVVGLVAVWTVLAGKVVRGATAVVRVVRVPTLALHLPQKQNRAGERRGRLGNAFPLVVRVGASETGALSLLVVVTVALVRKMEAMAVDGQRSLSQRAQII